MNTKKVLLPIDGSLFSRHILDYVCQFIKPEDVELVVLRVAPWPRGFTEQSRQISPINWLLPANPGMYDALSNGESSFHPIYASQEAERVRALILDELQDQTYQLQAAGYHITRAVEFGEPTEEIVNFVEHHAINMVAMATHGRSGLGHLVLGSVAEHVLRKVNVPVLLVRPMGHAEQSEASEHRQKEFSLSS